MAPMDRNKFRSQEFTKLPKFTADLIKGDKVVLTVGEAREVDPKNGNAPFIAIIWAEFPDFQFNTNRQQSDRLMAMVDAGLLPDEFPAWAGKRIALERVENENPETKEKVKKFYPMAAEKQVDAIAAFDEFVAKQKKSK